MAQVMAGLTKTNKWLHLYSPRMGWNRGFKRRIWEGEYGEQYVNMRGKTQVDAVIMFADWYEISHPYAGDPDWVN